MIDEREVREMLQRRAATVPATPADTPKTVERARRRILLNGALATVAAVAITVATFAGVDAIRSAPLPAVRPSPAPSEDLGVFAPVAGRIVYENEAEVGDLSYDLGVWAIDPTGPSDTTTGPNVADDVASTLVRLDLEEAVPLGWSSDGTELLFSRPDAGSAESLFPMEDLFILHADGSETRLNRDPMSFGGATISPDGTHVVIAGWGDDLGLWVLDAEGGRPARVLRPAEGLVADPTFSPDGTQIAYVDSGDLEGHVWVMDADGSNAHEILAGEPTLVGGAGSLQWSPAGDRLAIQVRAPDPDGTNAIYTFAPDGSDFRQIITGGLSPHWSPDGSQIAYTIECDLSDTSCGGLAIADADGSTVREFGFAASGPWHPGAPVGQPAPAPTPTPVDQQPPTAAVLPSGEILWYPSNDGDLLAVNPSTGEERVIAEGLPFLNQAMWSADGRWVAYDMVDGEAWSLWVVGEDLEPRKVMALPDASNRSAWTWSSTGAQLAVNRNSTLHVIDPATGLVTKLASTTKVSAPPAWSPDGTRIVLGATDGTIYSVDAVTGERSVLAELPAEDLAPVHRVAWSPDGSRLAVSTDPPLGPGQLFVLNANGSNIRVLAEFGGNDPRVQGLDWSPDGSRIVIAEDYGTEYRIWVVPADGSIPSLVAVAHELWGANPVWSPDGSQIAFSEGPGGAFVIDADGSGDVAPIDDLTYASWSGGSFCWECLWFIRSPSVHYTGPSDS